MHILSFAASSTIGKQSAQNKIFVFTNFCSSNPKFLYGATQEGASHKGKNTTNTSGERSIDRRVAKSVTYTYMRVFTWGVLKTATAIKVLAS